MELNRTIIGAHAYFFRGGDAYTLLAAGTCGRNAKPDATDPAWLDLGVSDWTPQPKGTDEPFNAPAPGARVLYDVITTMRGLTWKGKLMEIGNLAFQMIYSTQALPLTGAGGQYNPLGGDHNIAGWLKIQQYNQDNVLLNTMDVWTKMKVSGDTEMGDKPVDVTVEAPVLFSQYNTGTLT